MSLPHRARRLDDGYTLVETIVIMLIVAVLAGLAVPLFLAQQGKAHDSVTKADVGNLAKEISTYFVDGTGTVELDYSTPGQIRLRESASSEEIAWLPVRSVPPAGAGAAYRDLGDATAWCVSLTHPDGRTGAWRYMHRGGLEAGTCA